MKNSDSANSLTALYPDEPECFVCLESNNNEKNEPVVHGSLVRTCGCKFMVHPTCWNQWAKDKTDYDCPICRKDSLVKFRGIPPNPVLAVVYTDEPRPSMRPTRFGVMLCGIGIIIATILVVSMVLWG